MRSRKSKGNPWADHYTRKARKENFPARSVYKLEEIQKKHRLIRKGQKILDLGCAPGSWLKYAAEITGSSGRIVGVDLKPVTIALPNQVQVIEADVFSLEGPFFDAQGRDFNGVISDMAPATTGHASTDAARSAALCQAALSIAENGLAPGGFFICKIFQGEDFNAFLNSIKAIFKKQKNFKPQSSRKASREMFVIGTDKK